MVCCVFQTFDDSGLPDLQKLDLSTMTVCRIWLRHTTSVVYKHVACLKDQPAKLSSLELWIIYLRYSYALCFFHKGLELGVQEAHKAHTLCKFSATMKCNEFDFTMLPWPFWTALRRGRPKCLF